MDNKIRFRDGYMYQLAELYTVQTRIKLHEPIIHGFLVLNKNGVLMISPGYAWDGPSGPSIPTKSFMRGSLVHDALYQLMREKLLDVGWRELADMELRRICQEDGMSWIRAWWVFQAVRKFGESSATWQEPKIITAP